MPMSVARRKAAEECRALYEQSLERRKATDPTARVLAVRSQQIHDGDRPLISNLLHGQYTDRGNTFLWDASIENGSASVQRHGRRTTRSFTPSGRPGSAMTMVNEGTQTQTASVARAASPAPVPVSTQATQAVPPPPQPAAPAPDRQRDVDLLFRPSSAPAVGYRPGSKRSMSAGGAEVTAKIGAHAGTDRLNPEFCGFVPRGRKGRGGGNAYAPVLGDGGAGAGGGSMTPRADSVAASVAACAAARPHSPAFTARVAARGGATTADPAAAAASKIAFLSKADYEQLRRTAFESPPPMRAVPNTARAAPVIAPAAQAVGGRFRNRPRDRANLIM